MGLGISKAQGEILGIKIAKVCAVTTILLGFSGLLGNMFHLSFLRGLSDVTLQMKANTAVGLILIGIALYLQILPKHLWQLKWSHILSTIVILMGFFTLLEIIFGFNFGIDQLIFPEQLTADNPYPGRMIPATALNFLLKGLALIFLDWELRSGRRPSQYISLFTALFPLQILIAYSHGKDSLMSVGEYPFLYQMSPHTAIAWITLSLGTLCARPLSGLMAPIFSEGVSAKTFRSILCAAILLPPILSWLATVGGAWDFYHPGFGASMLTMLMIILFVSFIWRSNRSVVAYETVLREQAKELKNSNEALGRFAAVASHDLKSPLQSMVLNVELLERRKTLPLDDQAKQNLKGIKDAAHKMSALIDKLLEYTVSKETAGEVHDVDLNEVLKSVLQNLRTQIEEVKPILDVPNLPVVQGDMLRLTQLFQNLVANALKYRKSGPCIVRTSVIDRGDHWLFCIRDNGIGFDPKYANMIFEPFKRLSNSTQKSGTGIGLATCWEVVQQHRGRIWAESKPNEGSSFYFTISKSRFEKSVLLELAKKV